MEFERLKVLSFFKMKVASLLYSLYFRRSAMATEGPSLDLSKYPEFLELI